MILPVLQYNGLVVHLFRTDARRSGGAGGSTLCGQAFVSQRRKWTYDRAQIAKAARRTDCKACLARGMGGAT